MEDNPRGFEPIKVDLIGAETGRSRFYKDGEDRTPQISYWRVNLTALSQKFNLYFVAVGAQILVYRPEFPYQTLGDRPSLTIVPRLENPAASGCIDEIHPHALTHLIVGDLGTQEILLLATDSGNVAAYYTSSIVAAIDKDPYAFNRDGNADLVGLRPFFSRWVHESAWGLAIHTAGRMIAVSANKPDEDFPEDPCSKITVFAFALTEGLDNSENEDEASKGEDQHEADHLEWRLWQPLADDTHRDAPPRDRNYQIVLTGPSGHMNNIPSISFVNTLQDVDGSWIFSTDIDGRIKLWQIWRGVCFKTWDFSNHNATWIHNQEAGWLVAALDPDTFRPASTMDEFIGFHRAPQYYGYRHNGHSYDLTSVVANHTPQNHHEHPFGRSDPDHSDEEVDELYQTMAESDAETDPESTVLAPVSSHAYHSRNIAIEDSGATIDERDHSSLSSADEENSDDSEPVSYTMLEGIADILSDDEGSSNDLLEEERSPNSLISATTISSFGEEMDDVELEMSHVPSANVEDSIASSSNMYSRPKRKPKSALKSAQARNQSDLRVPMIPFLQCSSTQVRLLSNPNFNTPHIFCGRLLKQPLSERWTRPVWAAMERMNMMHQIPELGIVLIASQMGRCAVCSLTKRKEDGLLGLRVDWILPTTREETQGIRPNSRVLLGIAVAPLQGQEVQEVKPISEYDTDDDWARDRVINGVPTTFDPHVFQLRARMRNVNLGNESTQVLDRGQSESAKSISRSKSPAVILEKRDWVKPKQLEDWKVHDSSRRYRLMMTYTDSTVLTYEISRGPKI